jgi:hypothetical protein
MHMYDSNYSQIKYYQPLATHCSEAFCQTRGGRKFCRKNRIHASLFGACPRPTACSTPFPVSQTRTPTSAASRTWTPCHAIYLPTKKESRATGARHERDSYASLFLLDLSRRPKARAHGDPAAHT